MHPTTPLTLCISSVKREEKSTLHDEVDKNRRYSSPFVTRRGAPPLGATAHTTTPSQPLPTLPDVLEDGGQASKLVLHLAQKALFHLLEACCHFSGTFYHGTPASNKAFEASHSVHRFKERAIIIQFCRRLCLRGSFGEQSCIIRSESRSCSGGGTGKNV